MSAQSLNASTRGAERRKSPWILALLAVALGMAMVPSSQARLVCARVQLPASSPSPSMAMCLAAGDGLPGSFLRASLSGVPDGYTVSNGLYRAWATAYPSALPPEAICGVRMHLATGTLPPALANTNWDRVSYLLNHKQGSADEVQAAIWLLLGQAIDPADARFAPPSEAALGMVADALANGAGFIPQSGQVAAVLVEAEGGPAPVLVEVMTVPDRMPVAGPDAFSVTQGNPLQLLPPQLLANDSDPDGDALFLVDVTTQSAQGGVLTFDGAQVIYLPPAGFSGVDSFSYGLGSAECGRAIGTVLVNVTPAPNGQPAPQDDGVTTERDQPLVIPGANLLGNDTDPDNDTLVIVGVSTNSTRGGQVQLDGNQVVYTPPPGFVGTDTFTYTVSDGRGGTATAMVTVTVTMPPNRAPAAVADDVATDENQTLTIPAGQLLANDTDPDDDPLLIIGVNAKSSQGGTVVLNGTNVVYTPPPGFEGQDTFTYTISDGRGGTATATVTVTVRHVNQPPLAGSINLVTPLNTPLQIGLGRLMELAVDPDGDLLHLVDISPNTREGGRAILGSASVQYTPRLSQLGSDDFTYVVQDPDGARGTGVVHIAILAAPLGMAVGEPVHNTQTGLFEQRVTIVNNGALALAALRIDITGLRSNIVVWNASGTNDGVPFITYNRSLDPGQSVVVRIEYYVPDRRSFSPVINVVPVPPAAPKTATGTEGVAISRSFMDNRIPDEPRYVIEFGSTPGRIYTIIYSDDMKTWKTAVPAVTATANRTQWYDDGPPKTDSRPAEQGARFYRVIESP